MFSIPYSQTFLPLNLPAWAAFGTSSTFARQQNKLTPSLTSHKRPEYWHPTTHPCPPMATPSPDITPRTRHFVQRLPPLCTRQHTQIHGCSTQLVFPGQRHLGDKLFPQAGASR